jgi:hypothetical protein
VTTASSAELVATNNATGQETTIMTATLSGTVATWAIAGGTQSLDLAGTIPSSLTAFGHTISAQSGSESSISGPIIKAGSSSLVEDTTTTGTTSGTYQGTTQSQSITIKGPVGACNKPPCPLVHTDETAAVLIGAMFSGIAFAAGVVGLALFLPEMTALAVAVAVVDVLASFAALCWDVIWNL